MKVAPAADPEIAGAGGDLPGVHVREHVGEVEGIAAAVDRDVVPDADDRDLAGIGAVMYCALRTWSRLNRLASWAEKARRYMPVFGVPVVSSVMPARQGFWSLTRASTSTVPAFRPGAAGPSCSWRGFRWRSEVPGDRVDVGCCTRRDRGERAADVGLVEVAVAFDDEAPDGEFGDFETHDAVAEFLLGEG